MLLGLTRGSIPVGKRRVKSQLFENLIIQSGDPHNRKLKRLSVPGIYTNFEPPDEKEEIVKLSEHGKEKIREELLKMEGLIEGNAADVDAKSTTDGTSAKVNKNI